ncbi:MAG TPA: DM13 domain-containing protein [Jatrophihabitantaceae bacterium]|nr:DM13 domain-containing protein [Jatrophihabitantaceae bacterium]
MRTRTRVLLAAGVVVLCGIAFGLYWFQPWKLWVDDKVNEALPAVVFESAPNVGPPASSGSPTSSASPASTTPTVAAGPRVLSRGSLISHEHSTSGKVTVLAYPDGSRSLAISSLNTSNGPDVHVWLSDQKVTKDGWHVFDDGRHIDLGGIKGNIGNALYKIPKSADLSTLTSVSIWCERFSVSFGAAELVPV